MAKKKAEQKKKIVSDQEAIKGKKFATIESSHEHNVGRLKQILETFIDGDQLILAYKPSPENIKAKKYWAFREAKGKIEFASALMVEATGEMQYNVGKHLTSLVEPFDKLIAMLSSIKKG